MFAVCTSAVCRRDGSSTSRLGKRRIRHTSSAKSMVERELPKADAELRTPGSRTTSGHPGQPHRRARSRTPGLVPRARDNGRGRGRRQPEPSAGAARRCPHMPGPAGHHAQEQVCAMRERSPRQAVAFDLQRIRAGEIAGSGADHRPSTTVMGSVTNTRIVDTTVGRALLFQVVPKGLSYDVVS